MTRWTAADVPDQHGRTVMITGANSGLGAEMARERPPSEECRHGIGGGQLLRRLYGAERRVPEPPQHSITASEPVTRHAPTSSQP